MGIQMLCASCLRTDQPETVVEGSDRVELALWCCLLLPGLLYCTWRHATQLKICPHCGSGELIRESRAARRARESAASAAAPAPCRVPRRRRPPGLLARRGSTPESRLRRARVLAPAVVAAFAIGGVLAVNTLAVRRLPPAPVSAARAVATPAAAVAGALLPRSAAESRECEAVCAQIHGPDPLPLRRCVQSCAVRLEREPRPLATLESCGGLLDQRSCAIFATGSRGEIGR